jgi:pimeloyl-ACP methyl ester carboxylesterase/ABC-type transport system involved in multi-copper enzyme maturation permease subunit
MGENRSFSLPVFISIIALICLTIGASPLPVYAEGPTSVPRFEPTDCRFEIPQGETIQCGYLIVPENRSRRDSLPIRISVTIVKSHSPAPAPDPIIYLRGGLGRPTQWFIERELSQVDAWLAKRDLVLFDQRGLGWSQPALNCPEVHASVLQQRLGANLTIEEQLAPRLACRDRWLDEGIDLAAYNSFETAADVADLWQTLGYEQVNLIGTSYWTIIAQLVMRDYGKTGHIRSAVLDSPVPVTVPVMAETPAQVASSMAQLFEKCEADLFCRAAYPDLESIYRQVMQRLQASPVTLSATDPRNGEPFSFQFTIDDFGFLIQYGPYRKLPSLIYDIYDGDYTQIIADREQSVREFNLYNAGEHFGFRTTMNCNEPWQTISPEQRAAMAVYPESVFMNNPLDTALCKQWPGFVPPIQTPVVGDIPVLVFTAGYDIRLPAAYGDLIADSLNQGFHFAIPGASHDVLRSGGPCPYLMLLSFLDDPTHAPDSRCLATAGPSHFDTQFVIRAAAARRPVQVMLGIMSMLVMGLVVGAGLKIGEYRSSGLRLGFAWRHSLHIVGWLPSVITAGLIWFAFYAGQTHLLPIRRADAMAMVLPIIVAIQAAFLFSPEDEPALEVMLATARPPAWTLLERLATLFIMQGGVGVAASMYLAYATGEPLTVTIVRWLPLLFFLSGTAVYLTLATRRAIFGVLVVCLLWIVLALFGAYMVDRWPVAWPFHLYLQPNQAEYALNRLFITLLGLSLISLATARLLRDPERLLLGNRKARQASQFKAHTKAAEVPGIGVTNVGIRARFIILTQLAGMIRYEFLLQWRRTALPALVVGLIITPILGVFIAQSAFRGYRAALASGTLSLEVAKADITAAMIPVMWLGASLIAVLMIPLVVADTIPKDRQAGVRELLDSLPLSPGTYLAGKLFSLWLSLLVGVGLAALIAGVVWWLVIGPFKLEIFLDLWLVGVMLLTLINAGLSMLLAAGQPTNRRAILVGGAYVLLCLVGMGFVFSADTGWWRWLNPARPALMLYYTLGFPGAIEGNDDLTRAGLEFLRQIASREDVLRSLGAGLVEVGLVGLVVWQWLRRGNYD